MEQTHCGNDRTFFTAYYSYNITQKMFRMYKIRHRNPSIKVQRVISSEIPFGIKQNVQWEI